MSREVAVTLLVGGQRQDLKPGPLASDQYPHNTNLCFKQGLSGLNELTNRF